MKIDATKSQIVLTAAANSCLESLGVGNGHRDRHDKLIEQAHADAVDVRDDLMEKHYLAATQIDGRDVVLLCAHVPGSRHAGRDSRVVIRGAFSPQDAASLASMGRGLAAFASQLNRGTNANGQIG